MPKLIRRVEFNPDFLFFSDLHLHDRKEFSNVDPKTGLNSRFLEGLNILDQIIDILIKNPTIGIINYLGDIFESKDRIPNHILIEFRNKLEHILTEPGQYPTFYALRGNHDFNIPKYPTLDIFRGNPRFTFINGPSQYGTMIHRNNDRGDRIFEGHKITYFLPFERKWEDFKKEWQIAHNQEIKPSIICMHQEIPGGVYESGKTVPGIFDLELDPDILYLSGHLHKAQKVHGIQFLGSPYPTKFLPDDDGLYYIWLYDSKTKQLRPKQLEYSKFLNVELCEYINSLMSDGDWKSKVDGNYVKIVGEMNYGDWGQKEKKDIKERFEKYGAKTVLFNVKIKRPSQSKIPESLIENDDEIIKDYAKKNKESLDQEKLIQIGIDTFHNAKG